MDECANLRQKKAVYYARNGAAIYGCTRDCLVAKGSLYGERIVPYVMAKEESVDIDDRFDLQICENILNGNITRPANGSSP